MRFFESVHKSTEMADDLLKRSMESRPGVVREEEVEVKLETPKPTIEVEPESPIQSEIAEEVVEDIVEEPEAVDEPDEEPEPEAVDEPANSYEEDFDKEDDEPVSQKETSTEED